MQQPSLQNRLHRAAQAAGLPLQVIEKDYTLSYLLAGISSNTVIHEDE